MTATGQPLPRETPARRARRRGKSSREPLRGRAGLLEGAGTENASDLLAVEGLALEQGTGQSVKLLDVLLENLPGATRAFHHDPLDLGVDEKGGLFAVVLLPGHLAAEEDVLLVLAEGQGPELVRHAPLADHLASHLGRLLQIVTRAGGLLVQHDLFGGPAAEQDRDAIDQVLLRVIVLVVDRELLREPEGAAARDDRHFVDRVGARQNVGHQRVARLVIRDRPLLAIADDHRAPLDAHQDLVLGALEVGHLDELLVLASRQQRRLVHEVRQIGAREPGRPPRQHLELDVGSQRDPSSVHPENLLAALHVGPGHDDLTVESSGPQQRRVEDVGPVGGGDQDDAFVRLEAVHLDEELVEGLLPLVVTSAEAGPAVAPNGIDLVHEDDAGRVLLALLEQIAHARGAHAHEHLHEVGARDRKERDVRLTGDRLGEQRLACARRSDEKHALRDLATELLELLRVLQEIDDLAQFFLGLVHSGDILEGDFVLLLRNQPGPRLPEAQRLGATPLHLAHEEDPDADEEQHRHPLQEDRVPRVGVGRLHRDADAAVLQGLDEVRVLEDVRALRLRRVLERVRDEVAPDDDGFHPALIERLEKLGEVRLLLATLLRALEDGEQEDDDQADHHPERKVLVDLVHARPVIITPGPGDGGERQVTRSEERRVGKECRSRWSPYH